MTLTPIDSEKKTVIFIWIDTIVFVFTMGATAFGQKPSRDQRAKIATEMAKDPRNLLLTQASCVAWAMPLRLLSWWAAWLLSGVQLVWSWSQP
jgi:hypothetical protein